MTTSDTKEAKAGEVPTDTQLIDMLRDESMDLRGFTMPTGQGDADIGWKVIDFYMGHPQEREVAVVYRDDPREALRQAYMTHVFKRAAAGPRPQAKGEQPSDYVTIPRDLAERVDFALCGACVWTEGSEGHPRFIRVRDEFASRLAGQGEQPAPTDTSHLNCLEAQAIDRAYAICEPCNTGFPERCLYKRPKGEQPAPAADLHAQIMNLPIRDEHIADVKGQYLAGYRLGHRDARHAAAELVSASAPAPAGGALAGVSDEIERLLDQCLAYQAGVSSAIALEEAQDEADNRRLLAAAKGNLLTAVKAIRHKAIDDAVRVVGLHAIPQDSEPYAKGIRAIATALLALKGVIVPGDAPKGEGAKP